MFDIKKPDPVVLVVNVSSSDALIKNMESCIFFSVRTPVSCAYIFSEKEMSINEQIMIDKTRIAFMLFIETIPLSPYLV